MVDLTPRHEFLELMPEGDRMTFSKKDVTRRQAITAGALGTLAAGYPRAVRAAEPTAQEKANIQVVSDFCEAWRGHDVGKIMSYFSDNCAYRLLETMEPAKGRDAVENQIKRFVNNVERFQILETWASGPMVINRRTDHFTAFQIKAWHGTGVFYLKGGKIVEWFDYTTSTDPA